MNGPQVWSGRNVRALIVAGVALAAASCSSSDDGATISAGTETVQTTVATTTDATATTSTTASTAPTVSIASLATPLQLVVIGDSTSNADTCPGCQGYVDQYATELESRINRPVNTTRIDASVLPDAESAVTSDVTARDQVAAADVVIVAVGFNNVLPDPEYTVRIATHVRRRLDEANRPVRPDDAELGREFVNAGEGV